MRGELREGAGGLKCGEGRVCGGGAWWVVEERVA